MFITIINATAQSDTVSRHSLDYSTKDYSRRGIYISGAHFSTVTRFVPNDSTDGFHFYDGFNGSLQIESKRNVAINIWYADASKSNYKDTWFNNKITIIGSNINFPLYKYYKHLGFYMMGGISWKKITGYYTTSSNTFAQAVYKEHSPYSLTTWGTETGIGFEYKFKYLQFYTLFKFRFDNYYIQYNYIKYGPITESFDCIIGARFKIPKKFKNPKQRYRWF